jgi:ligand-binding sensor domain-containing protein/signal transduction histidine kinase
MPNIILQIVLKIVRFSLTRLAWLMSLWGLLLWVPVACLPPLMAHASVQLSTPTAVQANVQVNQQSNLQSNLQAAAQATAEAENTESASTESASRESASKDAASTQSSPARNMASSAGMSHPVMPPPTTYINSHSRFMALAKQFPELSVATSVVQDAQGFLWIGTQNGVYRFDGSSVSNIALADRSAVGDSRQWVTTLSVDPQQRLWIGTRAAGVYILHLVTGAWHALALPQGAANAEITAIVHDSDGGSWIATHGAGLFRVAGASVDSKDATVLESVTLPSTAEVVGAKDINTLWRDAEGYLWLGTGAAPLRKQNSRQAGLLRWHPVTQDLQWFHPENSVLTHASISILRPDPQGNLWIGAYGGGLYRYRFDRHQLERWPDLPPSLATGLVTDILVQDKRLWVSSFDHGLWLLQDWSSYDVAAAKTEASKHTAASSASLTSSTSNAASDQSSSLTSTDGTPRHIWWQRFGFNPLVEYQLGSNNLTQLWLDQQHTLWMASPAGVFGLSSTAQDVRNLPFAAGKANSLQYPDVFGVAPSQTAGVFWLANRDAGLVLFDSQTQHIRHFKVPPTPNQPAVTTAFTASVPGAPTAHIAPTLARQVVETRDGRVFIGTDAGLYRLHPFSGDWELQPLQTPEPHIGVMQLGPDGDLWIGTRGDGLLRWRPPPSAMNGASDAQKKHGPESQPDTTATLDTRLNTVIARLQARYRAEQDAHHKRPPQGQIVARYGHNAADTMSLRSDSIGTMAFDQHQYLWLGFPGQGLSRIDSRSGDIESWEATLDRSNGLATSVIESMFQYAGHFWLWGNGILHRVEPDLQQPERVRRFYAYTPPLQVDEALRAGAEVLLPYMWALSGNNLVQLAPAHGFGITFWLGAVWLGEDGFLVRGGNQGVDFVAATSLRQGRIMPTLTVQLTEMRLFNQPVPSMQTPLAQNPLRAPMDRSHAAAEQRGAFRLPQPINQLSKLELSRHEDMFSLLFSALDFVAPQQVQYRYRLLGFDANWIETSGTNPMATYTRLAPGQYQFEVMARPQGGLWPNAPSLRLSIDILPAWWQTLWFKVGLLVLIGGAMVAALRWRWLAERAQRRQLAALVRQRTAELEQQNKALSDSYRDLMLLQTMVSQITATLSTQEVISQCQAQLQQVMDVHVLAVGIFHAETERLHFDFWLESGQWMTPFSLATSEQQTLAAVCFSQQRELIIARRQDFLNYLAKVPAPVAGEPMQSVLYFPLQVHGHVLGCITVQSPQPQAFTSMQIQLVRTLSSTIAIALANAAVVADLRQTQQQMVEQEKLASLGALVSGVAHEVNTPLGICVTAATHLQQETQELSQLHQQQKLTGQRFEQHLQVCRDTLTLLTQNAMRAANLIQRFKQVAVDRHSQQGRELHIAHYIHEVMHSLQAELKRVNGQFQIDCADDLLIYTEPGVLAQVFGHLLTNAVEHAFMPALDGSAAWHLLATPQVDIKIYRQAQWLVICFKDNGIGMTPQVQQRIFEPFFTTQRANGHSGLGAHIMYNLVTGQLGGRIEVQSAPGEGTQIIIRLPLRSNGR